MGVEPTKDRLAAPPGFEVRTPHRGRFSSLVRSFRKIFAKFLPHVARCAADFAAANSRGCGGRRDDAATRGFEMTQAGASDIAEVEDVIGKLTQFNGRTTIGAVGL
jgi:hypothetical protein